jgi:hypothetical protein
MRRSATLVRERNNEGSLLCVKFKDFCTKVHGCVMSETRNIWNKLNFLHDSPFLTSTKNASFTPPQIPPLLKLFREYTKVMVIILMITHFGVGHAGTFIKPTTSLSLDICIQISSLFRPNAFFCSLRTHVREWAGVRRLG